MIRIHSLAVLVLAAALAAQCPRPVPPRGGFTLETLPQELVTYRDGVVAEGRLIRPIDAPPSCGWPLVVRVHSLGASRDQDLEFQQRIASLGFAVWAYDVRGQASTRFHNQSIGTTIYGGNERFDLAEQIVHVRTAHAASVSADRVAVIGVSQGGVHAWMAAAQSGQPLTVPGRGTIQFPTIACVVGTDYAAEPIDHTVRGGTLFSTIALDTATLDPNTQLFAADTSIANLVRQHFLAQDPAGLVSAMRAEPGREIATLLGSSAVPILFAHAWHDAICDVGFVLDGLHRLPPTTPWRLLASTTGHGVPHNLAEDRERKSLALRWLERFLWDEHNGVDQEARVLSAALPLDPATHDDSQSLWHRDFDADLPVGGLGATRWFTTDAGVLDPIEPPVAGVPTRIEHQVAAGHDAARWMNDLASRELAAVLAAMPLSERAFDVVLANPASVFGAATVHLRVAPQAERFTLAALLLVREPGASEFRMLAHGARGVLDAVPQQPRDVDVTLSPISARLPAGTTLRLVLRNHWLTEAPHLHGLIAVPLFVPSIVDVLHGSGVDASWLDLPLRPAATFSLRATRDELVLDAPAPIDFVLDGDQGRAGWHYLVAASLTGQSPGTILPGGVLPLVVDPLTEIFGMLVWSPELVGFFGVLDQDGRARPRLDLSGLPSLPLALAGRRMTFAAWVQPSLGQLDGLPSTAVDVLLR